MYHVTLLGDLTNVNVWSGTAYYFYNYGKRIQLFDKALNIDISKIVKLRNAWNLKELLLLKGVGGFQYSDMFLNHAEKQISKGEYSQNIITFSQHFPRVRKVQKNHGQLIHYIDATFQQLSQSGSYNINLSKKKIERIKSIEAENYQGAKMIVTMSDWAKQSLINDYQVDPEKIFKILPGANLELPENFRYPKYKSNNGKESPFVFGFIGKDWKRKGLLTLIDICKNLQKLGIRCEIHAIGFDPKLFEHEPLVKSFGYINKHKELDKFIAFMQGCDLGCLFSEDEALGISVYEFLSVGVQITGYSHQGMAETVSDSYGVRLSKDQSIEEMSDILHRYIENDSLKLQQYKKIQEDAYQFTWARCIDQWNELLNTRK